MEDERTHVVGDQRAHAAAEPPGRGRTDQGTIREAAHRPLRNSDGSLAAGGGLELPAGEVPPPAVDAHNVHDDAAALIPGAREADTLTYREPGSIGGSFSGADIPSATADWLDDRTAAEHYREGGDTGKSAERKVRESHGEHK